MLTDRRESALKDAGALVPSRRLVLLAFLWLSPAPASSGFRAPRTTKNWKQQQQPPLPSLLRPTCCGTLENARRTASTTTGWRLRPILAVSTEAVDREGERRLGARGPPISVRRLLPRAAAAALVRRIASLVLRARRAALSRILPVLWPNSRYDAGRSEPLPPGSMGCPIVGRPFFWGSSTWGSGSFFRSAARRLGWPRAFKFYFLGCPFVSISGLDNLKLVLNKEFDPESGGIKTALYLNELLGKQSLAGDLSKDRHQFLRRLVRQSLTPAAVASSLPVLEGMAMEQIRKLVSKSQNDPVLMDRVVTDYTLNIAWKQILGLDLTEEEVPEFSAAVDGWIRGLVSARAYLGYKVRESSGFRALRYLEARVAQRIDDLERTGPDGFSALSGMVFATDDEEQQEEAQDDDAVAGPESKRRRKLSRREVIDNALLLVLAGSETVSSTLANAVLLLGLHRGAWRSVVGEQRRVRDKYGEALTREALDKDAAPYLDAVVKESLRLRPLSITFPRVATETLVVNGNQIPRGWFVDWNAVLTHELDPVTYREDGSHMDIVKGFRPERWLSDDTAPSEFVPFGHGPRYCLGANLAYAEMKVFLSLLARNVDFELSGRNMKRVVWKHTSLIAKVKDGLPVTVWPASMPSASLNPTAKSHPTETRR